MKIHHIVNMCYAPTDKAKELYEEMKGSGEFDALFINAGSLKNSTDPWVKENVT